MARVSDLLTGRAIRRSVSNSVMAEGGRLAGGGEFAVKPSWAAALREVSEGGQTTFGAYDRGWQ